MTQEEWRLAWGLICQIQDRSAAEQEAALLASAAPEGVLEHVREVLASGSEPEDCDDPPLEAGEWFGPYQLVRFLGEGSMGTVYLAQQEKPLRRLVALKLIRPGLRSGEVLKRFEIERRALAMMDHANIARVFEAGETEHGTPYFAMEFVPGVAITAYCERRQVPLRHKLELLICACEAIQHAHQKGIVHRDIKPSNVLVAAVDGRPQLKIIDFGIARATQEAGIDTLGTNFGSVVGTVAYMSPEQAVSDSSRIDTRSDVFSLGVLTYQLLTGTTPIQEQASPANMHNLLQRARLEDPEPPSRRAPAQAKQLAGELDWIVMKALEKDPARRYQTANGLALDIQRYLRGEPVEAGPPSNTYRLKKLAIRHRALLATVAAFALVLILATVVSVRQAVRATIAEQLAIGSRDRAVQAEAAAVASRDEARRAEGSAKAERDRATAERQRADHEAAATRAVSDFLQNDLLKLANTAEQADRGYATPTRDIKVREALDRAAVSIGSRFQNQPEVEAEIRHTIGTTYFNLDLLPQAKTQLEAAYRLRREKLGPWHPATLDSLYGIGTVQRAEGRFAEAVQTASQVAEGRSHAFGPEHRDTLRALHSIAVGLRSQGKTKEAIAQHRKIWETRRRALGEEDADTLRSLNDLAVANIYAGNSKLGLELAERAYRQRSRVLGPEHPDTVVSLQAYGMGLFETDQGEKALEALLQVRQLSERLRGPDHANTLNAIGSIGNAYVTLRRFDEAAKYFSQAADGFVRLRGERNPSVLIWRANAGTTMLDAGQFDEGVATLRAVLPLAIAVHGENHRDTLRVSHTLARGLLATGRLNEALEAGTPSLAQHIRQLGAGNASTGRLAEVVAQAYSRQGRLQEAEALYRSTIAAIRTAKGNASSLEAGLGAALLAQQRFQEAEAIARSAQTQGGEDPSWVASYLGAITGAALAGQGRFGEAEPLLIASYQAMAGQRGRVGATEHYKLTAVSRWIAGMYERQGKTGLAAQWALRP